MAVKHFIIISSSYADGHRIAMDFTSNDKLDIDTISEVMRNIKKECGQDVPLSTHCISTDSSEWISVQNSDSFFEGIVLYEDVEKFISTIQKSRILDGIDIAKYILSVVECTHTKLQKLAYLCYAEYLCLSDKRLFEDTIYAFTYGPVVKSIFETYRKSNGERIVAPESERAVSSTTLCSAAKSKLLFSEDGPSKLVVVDETIKKYGHLSASKLVEITHRAGSPWSCVYDERISYQMISDGIIKKHHSVEQ